MANMRNRKLYESSAWLYRQYTVLKRTPGDIAEECNTTVRTIYRKLVEFKIVKKR